MLRVAAYARVSTDKSDQLNSLEHQIAYFRKYITADQEWEYTGIYIDEGISGTSIKRRVGFQKMLLDGGEKKFDLLLTKEISRFARNTLDSIYYTRQLKELGIGVVFLNDGINTLDSDAELRLTIMASIAQEESRKTSVRVKWGQKRSMEQGVVFGRDLLGYKVIAGKLYIDLKEAEIVKSIFHKFVNDKKGVYTIAKELTKKNIPTALHNQEWHGNVILKILKNEKYCGDLIQKKTYTPNYLLHEKKINTGQEEKVYLINHHEPIIDRELFDKAKKELHRRSKSERVMDRHTNKYCFSGLIKCGICGSSYVIRKKTGKNGREYQYWKCYEQVKHGKRHESGETYKGCDNPGISEEDLKELMLELIRKLNIEEEIVTGLLKIIPFKEENNNVSSSLRTIEKEKITIIKKEERLLNLYLEELISKDEYVTQKKAMEMRVAYINQQMQINEGKNGNNNEEKNVQSNEESIEEAYVKEGYVEEGLVNKKLLNEIVVDVSLVGGKLVEKVDFTTLEEQDNVKNYEYLLHIIRGRQYSETFVKKMVESIIIHENYILIKLNFMSVPLRIIRVTE